MLMLVKSKNSSLEDFSQILAALLLLIKVAVFIAAYYST